MPPHLQPVPTKAFVSKKDKKKSHWMCSKNGTSQFQEDSRDDFKDVQQTTTVAESVCSH